MTSRDGDARSTYLVTMPLAEARHLAGTGARWPAPPQSRLATSLREWVGGLSRRRGGFIQVRKVVTDLTRILESVPLPQRPVCGPFGPGQAGFQPPGRVEYLGSGIVRLDEAAVNFLAGLAPDEDFHVRRTAAGPVLSVGADSYLARQEEPDAKP